MDGVSSPGVQQSSPSPQGELSNGHGSSSVDMVNIYLFFHSLLYIFRLLHGKAHLLITLVEHLAKEVYFINFSILFHF